MKILKAIKKLGDNKLGLSLHGNRGHRWCQQKLQNIGFHVYVLIKDDQTKVK